MLVRQTHNTFIRTKGKLGYILNQATRLDRQYNNTGKYYLSTLSRQPQDIEEIVREKLLPLYDATFETIFNDFVVFLKDLEENGFVVFGESEEEMNNQEKSFSYSLGNMSTQHDLFLQTVDDSTNLSTQEALLEMTSETPYLMSIQFEVTSKCNERCIHCYLPNIKKDKGIDMPLPLFKSIIDQFSEIGGLQVALSEGEIFLHKDIMSMMEYCREKDMQIAILSNLISLEDDQIAKIKDLNISMVQASLYSMNPETHDRITKVKGSFYKTKKSIERLVAADIPVMISCPILTANKKDYKDILTYAHSLGIKAQTDFILMAAENLDTTNLSNRITLEDAELIIRQIIENGGIDTDDIVVKYNQHDESIKLKDHLPVCAAGNNNLCITSNGDAYPCNGWQAFNAGNLYKQTLKDIWENSDSLLRLRRTTRGDFKKCVDCEAAEYCTICMARNHNESGGDPLKINPHFCDIAFLNKRIHQEYINSKTT